jgi:hypothetical protein
MLKLSTNKITLLFALFIGSLISTYPQNLNGRISSSFYTYERYDSASSSETHLLTFQSVSLNFNKDNFSVRSYGDFEHDFTNPQVDDPRLRVYNFYVEGRELIKLFTVRLGRQPIFNSVAGGVMDGINLDMRKGDYKVTGYYGLNVPAYQKFQLSSGWNDNFIAGGKFQTSAIKNFDISLGYVNKNFKPVDYYATRLDENLNPITVLIQENSNQFQFANAEVVYNQSNLFTIDTRYDYDLNYKETSKFEFAGTYEQLEHIHFSAYYNYRQPLIRYNSIFSVFDYGNTKEYEVGAEYFFDKSFWLSARVGDVEYRDAGSQRITLGVNTNYGNITFRKTLGYEGELFSLSGYSAKTFLDGVLTPSVGIAFTQYRLSTLDPTNHLITMLAGFNYRPIRILSFDVQAQYMDNKIYNNDFRVFFKANYWFNTNF